MQSSIYFYSPTNLANLLKVRYKFNYLIYVSIVQFFYKYNLQLSESALITNYNIPDAVTYF